jgi:hypothetical protein
MTIEQDKLFLTFGVRKILLYYFGFSALFLIIHLSLISLVSFFHFLLDHEMAVIENWLYRNAWEIIIIAKFTAAYLTMKALKLNNYSILNLVEILKSDIWKPNRKIIVLILFWSIIFYALILQFGGQLSHNPKATEFTHISYLGSIFFYLTDFFVINVLVRNVEIKDRRKFSILILSLLVLFLLFTKAALPYINKYYVFIILHFAVLLVFLFKERKKLINPILYSAVIIGPFSSHYGLDIVWDNAHSFYSYQTSLPILGIIGAWLIGLGYYYRS